MWCTVASWAHCWIKCAGQLLVARNLVLMLRNRKKYFPFLSTVMFFPDIGNQEKTSCYVKVTSKHLPLPLWIPVVIFPSCCFPFLTTAPDGIRPHLNQRANSREEIAYLKVHFYTNSLFIQISSEMRHREVWHCRRWGLARQDLCGCLLSSSPYCLRHQMLLSMSEDLQEQGRYSRGGHLWLCCRSL